MWFSCSVSRADEVCLWVRRVLLTQFSWSVTEAFHATSWQSNPHMSHARAGPWLQVYEFYRENILKLFFFPLQSQQKAIAASLCKFTVGEQLWGCLGAFECFLCWLRPGPALQSVPIKPHRLAVPWIFKNIFPEIMPSTQSHSIPAHGLLTRKLLNSLKETILSSSLSPTLSPWVRHTRTLPNSTLQFISVSSKQISLKSNSGLVLTNTKLIPF